MKIYIFKGADNQWYWHVKAKNGKIIADSEGYKRKSSALKTVAKLKNGFIKAQLIIEG